jgi:hypothetical protein
MIRMVIMEGFIVLSGLGLMASVLAIGPKVCVFNPDRGRWIFKGDKNP